MNTEKLQEAIQVIDKHLDDCYNFTILNIKTIDPSDFKHNGFIFEIREYTPLGRISGDYELTVIDDKIFNSIGEQIND